MSGQEKYSYYLEKKYSSYLVVMEMRFPMTKPNFDAMSKAELRAYVYEHRNDQEAFYAFVDRLTAKLAL